MTRWVIDPKKNRYFDRQVNSNPDPAFKKIMYSLAIYPKPIKYIS